MINFIQMKYKRIMTTLFLRFNYFVFQIVKENVNTTCKCHGVSGSCTVRTCWRQLSPFRVVGNALKQKYERSFKVVSFTNQATGKAQLAKRPKKSLNSLPHSVAPRPGDLLYMEESPSFCRRSRYSPGTSGRICDRDNNCGVICCGRGYNVKTAMVRRSCQCQVIWCCHVNCKQCSDKEEIYMCK